MKMYIKLLIIVLLVFPFRADAQMIVTIAGNGVEGYSGDSSAAVSAKMHWPKSVAVDTFGNYYIADALNNVIRKVNTKGIITTIAGTGFESGTGTGGYAGDGAAATLAQLFNPEGVALDYKGNVLIADASNNRIRKIDTFGIITTIAGTGMAGYNGDNQPATNAELNMPTKITVDTLGEIFIADQLNDRIRKIDTFGNIFTYAGNGITGYSGDGATATAAHLSNPVDVAADRKGNLYIADQLNECIRKVDMYGDITTFAGNNTSGFRGDGGAATAAQLFDPVGVAVDTAGNVYISDNGNSRVRMVSDTSFMITTIAGNGTAAYFGDGGLPIDAALWFPEGLAVNRHGNVYIADQGNNRIRYLELGYLSVQTLNSSLTDLSIYPNPSGGTFIVNVSSAIEEQARIVITNVMGEKVNEMNTFTNHPADINIASPPGIYFLSATTANGVCSKRVVVY